SHPRYSSVIAFFFHHTPTTVIYTLSLHDALPILKPQRDDFSVVRERTFARSQAGENPLPGLHPAMARRKPKGRPAPDQTPRGDAALRLVGQALIRFFNGGAPDPDQLPAESAPFFDGKSGCHHELFL